MRTQLIAAALTAVAATATATPATAAAPKPQIVDPAGDAIGAQPGTDIRSVLFRATKSGRTTTGFTVTMTLGGKPNLEPGVLYRVYGAQSSCGTFQMSWSPGAALYQDQVYMTCGSDESVDGSGSYTIINVSPKVVGNALVWTFKVKQFPKEMRAGVMSELKAFVTLSEPVFGILNPTDFVEAAGVDTADGGPATFRY